MTSTVRGYNTVLTPALLWGGREREVKDAYTSDCQGYLRLITSAPLITRDGSVGVGLRSISLVCVHVENRKKMLI